MNLSTAQTISSALREELLPVCLRAEIAGSIRRCSPDPHDIDLVVIPSDGSPTVEFGQKQPAHPSFLERKLWQLQEERRLELLAGGSKLKRYALLPSNWGISGFYPATRMQITICTPDNWAYWYLIRTGPADFSKWIVTPKSAGGAIPNHLVLRDFCLWQGDTPLSTLDESEWLAALGLPFIPPQERRPRWRKP